MEFLDKLQRVCSQVAPGFVVQPILSKTSPRKLVVGNWSLVCSKEGEIAIHNADGTRVSLPLVKSVLRTSGVHYIVYGKGSRDIDAYSTGNCANGKGSSYCFNHCVCAMITAF